jgi:hypothetical protein
MSGGFGTVRVALLEDQTVAVKELRTAGSAADRAHFLTVRQCMHVRWTGLNGVFLLIEICARVESLGSTGPPKPPQIMRLQHGYGHVICSIHQPLLPSWAY